MKNKHERFTLANDIEFYDVCLNLTDVLGLSKNPFQTIGERMTLIEELEKNGFTITKGEKPKIETVTVEVDTKANIEIINFDSENSWVRWYFPDFSDNANIDLPKGKNWKLKHRIGNKVTVEEILTD